MKKMHKENRRRCSGSDEEKVPFWDDSLPKIIGHLDFSFDAFCVLRDSFLKSIRKTTQAALDRTLECFPILLSDKIFSCKLIQKQPLYIFRLPQYLQDNMDVWITALKQMGNTNDMEYMGELADNIPDAMWESVRFARLLQKHKLDHYIEYAPDHIQSNKSIVIELKMALEYASEELKNDHSFVVEFVNRHGIDTFQAASEALTNNPDFVMNTLQPENHENGWTILLNTTPSLRTSKEIIRRAIAQDGHNAQYSSRATVSDELIIELTEKGLLSGEGIPEEFFSNREVMLAALLTGSQKTRHRCKVLGERLQRWAHDPAIVLKALRCNISGAHSAAVKFCSDRSFIEHLIQLDLVSMFVFDITQHFPDDMDLWFNIMMRNEDLSNPQMHSLYKNRTFVKRAITENMPILI